MPRRKREAMVKIPVTEKWTQVTVTWEDIAHNSEPQDSEKYMENYKPAIRKTSGWFLGCRNNRVFITFNNDSASKDDPDYDTDCQAIDIIPIGSIIKFEPLVTKKRPRKKAAR
jgi:hypothetical protein